jgi:putative MATE family efflux protein
MGYLPDKPLTRTVLTMSTPAVAGLSSQMVVSVVDTAMVGRLDNTTVVLAAMGLGLLATWAITSVFSSLATGTQVLVSRRFGEREYAGAGAVLFNSLILALLLGFTFGGPGYYFSHAIIDFFAKDPAVVAAGTGYMQWRFIGLVFFLPVVAFRGFFNGIGHTKVFMYSAIIVNIANIVFDYAFIFGALGAPALGLTGAGVASALSNAIGCVYFLGATFLPAYRKRYRYYAHVRVHRDVISQIIRISTPVSFQNILILLGFLVFVAITGMIGTTEQAATQVVFTALFMSFLPCFGFGLGAQTLVGQTLGTGNKHLARRYGMEAARLATYFTIVVGAVFILLPDAVIMLITTNREVGEVARPILRVAGAAQVFYASGIVLAHALQAAGATVYVMFVEVLTHWVIFLPAAYVLGVRMGWGITGAWLALPVYIVSYSLLVYKKYRSDSWLSINV